jgi:glycosyltransferase involved in cell wall biosynthesis
MSIDQKKLIAIITNEYPPRLGGAGSFAMRLNEETGFTCLNPSLSNKLLGEGRIFTAKIMWLPELVYKLIIERKKLSRSVIVVNDFGGMLAYILVKYLFLRTKKRVVYVHHGLIKAGAGKMQLAKSKLLKLMTRDAYNIAVSKFLAEKLKDEGILANKVMHIGLNQNSCAVGNTTNKFSGRELNIVSMSRINEQKVPIESILYLSEVGKRMGVSVLYSIYGVGSNEHIEELVTRGERLGNIKVKYGGRLSSIEVLKKISECDIVFNPSTLPEACPTVSLEAAMANKPYIYNGENGNVELSVYHHELCLQIDLFSKTSAEKSTKIIKTYLRSHVNCIAKSIPTTEEIANEIRQIIPN